MKPLDIEIVSASAGSGKTHELMEQIKCGINAGIDPASLIAVTYTVKAASEISSRVREDLTAAGLHAAARNIGLARIGTVHSVCNRLIREFCFEIGHSPRLRVLAEEEQALLFEQAVMSTLTENALSKINELDHVFELDVRSFNQDEASGLLSQIREVALRARENAMSKADILASIEPSISRMLTFYPSPLKDDFKTKLNDTLFAYDAKYSEPPSEHKNTSAAHSMVKEAVIAIRGGGILTWNDWHKLSALAPAVKVKPAFQTIVDIASHHSASRALHDDLREAIQLVFGLAAEAVETFTQIKKEMGVCDYSDLECEALALLRLPEVRVRLQDEIKLVLVDEFQDTNPVQLAIFVELASLTEKSVWVGDLKQSIYGFRGADPDLMKSVIDGLTDRAPKILGENWRSRKELVEFSSKLFADAFSQDKIEPTHVKQMVPVKRSSIRYSGEALHVWKWAGSKSRFLNPFASQVEKLIKEAPEVVDRVSLKLRPLKPSDIAILCFSNTDISNISQGLLERGIASSASAGELCVQPVAALALSCFRWLIDSRDTVAAAEVSLAFGKSHNELFNQTLEKVEVSLWSEAVARLSALRPAVKDFTVSEKLESAIKVSRIEAMLERNQLAQSAPLLLTALRREALGYEDTCLRMAKPCTDTGFLDYLADEMPKVPADESSSAVNILTYHRSKGLEWPVVIMEGLEKQLRGGELFGRCVVRIAAGATFNPRKPLDSRCLLYMPWAYGQTSKVEGIDEKLANHKEAIEANEAARAESRRLLYVGMTRPRDRLIIVDRTSGKTNGTRFAVLSPESEAGWAFTDSRIKSGKLSFPCVTTELKEEVQGPSAAAVTKLVSVLPEHTESLPDYSHLRLSPSSIKRSDFANCKTGEAKCGSAIALGTGELLIMNDTGPKNAQAERRADVVGSAVHLFLASDRHDQSPQQRKEKADELLKAWGCENFVDLNGLLKASTILSEFLKSKWPTASTVNEVPMSFVVGGRVIAGLIDMLVVSESEVAIIDHKTTFTPLEKATEYALAHESQLYAYAEAVKSAFPHRKVSTWIHNPGRWITELKL